MQFLKILFHAFCRTFIITSWLLLLFALIELLLEVLLEVRHELFRLLSEH